MKFFLILCILLGFTNGFLVSEQFQQGRIVFDNDFPQEELDKLIKSLQCRSGLKLKVGCDRHIYYVPDSNEQPDGCNQKVSPLFRSLLLYFLQYGADHRNLDSNKKPKSLIKVKYREICSGTPYETGDERTINLSGRDVRDYNTSCMDYAMICLHELLHTFFDSYYGSDSSQHESEPLGQNRFRLGIIDIMNIIRYQSQEKGIRLFYHIGIFMYFGDNFTTSSQMVYRDTLKDDDFPTLAAKQEFDKIFDPKNQDDPQKVANWYNWLEQYINVSSSDYWDVIPNLLFYFTFRQANKDLGRAYTLYTGYMEYLAANLPDIMTWEHLPEVTFPTDGTPRYSLNRSRLNFGASYSNLTASTTFTITDSGTGTTHWTVSYREQWLSCSPTSGSGSGQVTVTVNASGLSLGTYTDTITVKSSNASNSPQTIQVNLTVTAKSSAAFGEFQTPSGCSPVYGAVPVSGWALDDIGVYKVQIFLESCPGEAMVYIGDAAFVEGAQPEIEENYPDYPYNYRSGWGYMLLTNALPGSGNGTFTLHAVAIDMEGNHTTLGSKTIMCDNKNSVTPFGAIDTPGIGGTVSGSSYRNFGWVLTPPPAKIPKDGSTINVYVDSMSLGSPVYNIYRKDIAYLFPDCANSDGSMAYFDFDTTDYTNGVHTIVWTAQDNVDHMGSIGFRYFTIMNNSSSNGFGLAGVGSPLNGQPLPPIRVDPGHIAINDIIPVYVTKENHPGHAAEPVEMEMFPNENGLISIDIKELDRLIVDIGKRQGRGEGGYSGYHLVGSDVPQMRRLPVGSTLDKAEGKFYWQAGPGFIGVYRLLFIKHGDNGESFKTVITINIQPKF